MSTNKFSLNVMCRSAALLAGVLCCLLQAAYAQVEVRKQAVPSPKDAWVPLPAQAAPAPAGLKGHIIYPSRVPVTGGPQRQPFDLILRAVGQEIKRDTAPTAVYRVTPPLAQVVFDPQFSSDGQTLMFKVGWPFEKVSTYRLFFWNIAEEKLLPGPVDNIANQNVAWSQDGRFVAYILGGDYEGNIWNKDDFLRLCIYDRQTKERRIVASNPGVTSFTWTPQNTLLFLSFSEEAITQSREAIRKNGRQPAIAQRPQLMEVPAFEGEPKVIAQNAYGNLYYSNMPPLSASPDAKWIAFYAWPEPKVPVDEKTTASGDKENVEGAGSTEFPGLYLLDRITGARILALHFSAHTQDFFTWTTDSRHLMLTRTSYEESNTRGKGEAKIIAVNTEDLSVKEIATLRLDDYQSVSRRTTDPQFEPLKTTSDSRFLIIKSWQATSPQANIDRPMTYPILNHIQAVELSTGHVTTIAETINRQSSSMGLDWSDAELRVNNR